MSEHLMSDEELQKLQADLREGSGGADVPELIKRMLLDKIRRAVESLRLEPGQEAAVASGNASYTIRRTHDPEDAMMEMIAFIAKYKGKEFVLTVAPIEPFFGDRAVSIDRIDIGGAQIQNFPPFVLTPGSELVIKFADATSLSVPEASESFNVLEQL